MERTEGIKFDGQKTQHELVPPYAQEQYAKVLTMGSNKYGARNWEQGIKWTRIIGAIKRHTLAIERGEDYDPETGLLHSAHLMCEAGFLSEYYKIFPQGDDRSTEFLREYRIGLDIDDVLSGFCPTFCARFGLKEPKFWMFDRDMGGKFEELSTDKDFWVNLPVKTSPDTLLFEPVCYITSRKIPKEWTEEWLDKNGFASVPVYQVGIDGSKVEVAKGAKLDIFVDDRFENFVELTKAGIFTYLFDAPHNRRYSVGHRRIYELNEIFNPRSVPNELPVL